MFAWQLHCNDALDSVLVLPNDFLTARHFTTAQLGISVSMHAAQGRLSVHMPSETSIPRLIAPGDVLEVIALWIQQAPIATFILGQEAETLADAAFAGGGGSIADEGSVLPTQRIYVQGHPISHPFTLDLEPVRAPLDRLVFSCTVMKLPEGGGSPQFVRFSHISYNQETNSYAYSIDTATLAPGRDRLIIGGTNIDLTKRAEIEILAPDSP